MWIPIKGRAPMLKASVIPFLTRLNIMPHFWSTAHWQMQYPLELDCNTDISLTMVKAKVRPNEFIRYCPDWSTAKKSGRPQKSEKILTLTDKMELASSSKKRKRRAKLYCKICHKFNHNTMDCFKNPINCRLDDKLDLVDLVDEKRDQDGDEGTA